MSRNSSGVYTLPAGNPVSDGTTIEAPWANSTLTDIGTALTDSLSRSGSGGMLAALRGIDGTVSAPALSFSNETGTGLYRISAGNVGLAITGSLVATFSSTGVVVAGSGITALNASNLASGTVPDARFPATLPALNGSALTNLNATNLASGTVADGRLSSNVPLKNAANVFSTYQTITATTFAYVELNGDNTGAGTGAYLGEDGSAAYLYQRKATPLDFGTNNTQRIRIAASGAVTINAPSSGQALTVSGAANEYSLVAAASSTASQSFGLLSRGGTTSSDYCIRAQNQAGSTDYFTVRGDGLVSAYNTATSALASVGFLEAAFASTTGSVTLSSGYSGRVLEYGGTGGHTVTGYAAADGTVVTVLNSGSATLALAPGSGTLYWFSGSAVSTGSRTLAVGGVASLYRASSNWYVWGNGIT